MQPKSSPEDVFQHRLSMRTRIVWTCSSSARTQRIPVSVISCPVVALRTFTNAPPLASGQAATKTDSRDDEYNPSKEGTEEGAMSRRLAEMTVDSIESGGSSAARNVQALGFSEELKKQLESRIADGAFRNQNQRAFAETEIPVCDTALVLEAPCTSSQHIVLSGKGHTRSSDSPTMDGHRVPPRLFLTNA